MTLEEIAELRGRRYNATVVYLRKTHPDLMILRVRPDFPRPELLPGQYTTLGLGLWEPRFPGCQDEELKPDDERRLVRRAYSLSCSILGDDGHLLDLAPTDWLEFYLVLVRWTEDSHWAPALTPRLFMLREGDRLQVGEKITGHFTLKPVKPDDNVLFLATGTGEAPHNYMIWHLLRSGHRGRIVSACCARYRRDLAYLRVHERLTAEFPNYTYVSLTTREGDLAAPKFYVQDLIASGQLEERMGDRLDQARTHVYLCGNPNMIGAPVKDRATGNWTYPRPMGVIELLETRYGFTADNVAARVKGNVHFEEYW